MVVVPMSMLPEPVIKAFGLDRLAIELDRKFSDAAPAPLCERCAYAIQGHVRTLCNECFSLTGGKFD